MSEHERSYIVASETWYFDTAVKPYMGKSVVEEFSIMGHTAESNFEFKIEWYDFTGVGGGNTPKPLSPRIDLFDDAWEAFRVFGPLLAELTDYAREHDGHGPDPATLRGILDEHAFVDETVRQSPYAPAVCPECHRPVDTRHP